MADSVVRNATKEDDSDIGYDDIVRMLEDDPYALDPLDQDTTTEPEEFIEPRDAIRDRILDFGGSEMEGGLADPSGILDAPMSDKVYMREGGLAMSGGGPLDSFRQFLMETIDQQQVDPFIDEINQMASERFNLGGGNMGGGSGIAPVTGALPGGGSGPLKLFEPPQKINQIHHMIEPAIIKNPIDMSRPSMFQQPTFSYEQAQRMSMTRDVKPPHIQAAIDAALQQGPLKSVNDDLMGFFDAERDDYFFRPQIEQSIVDPQTIANEPRILDRTLPRLFADGGGVASLMKKTTIEMQEVPADRNMLVMNRIMKQGGLTQTRDPRLMAQLAQVLGRDG